MYCPVLMGSFVYRIDLVINYTQLRPCSTVSGANRFVEVKEFRAGNIVGVIDSVLYHCTLYLYTVLMWSNVPSVRHKQNIDNHLPIEERRETENNIFYFLLSLFHFIDNKISPQPATSLQLKTNGIENISREIFFFSCWGFLQNSYLVLNNSEFWQCLFI